MNALTRPESPAGEMSDSPPLVLSFDRIDASDLPRVGGKGANLGEMARAGFPVPPGFCVTVAAFRLFLGAHPELETLYALLPDRVTDDLDLLREAGAKVRTALLELPMPPAVEAAVVQAWEELGVELAYAVRSSATAEDLPDASFAGQQDTYLNVRGREALLESVRRCWVSLFTDRAILYRAQNGFHHGDVQLAVVVQRMVQPDVSGIMFTADPITGNRNHVSIDAGFGLGEALVSGLVSADLYRVDARSLEVLEARIGDKALAIRSKTEGGTWQETLSPAQRTARVLTDAQAIELTRLATRIQAHYGSPQDIEWCIADGELFVVQSRPITSLYPMLEELPDDGTLHFYLCFNHVQVMTDPMSRMGLSIWRHLFPVGRIAPLEPNPVLIPAGGRLYVDLTYLLRHTPARSKLPLLLGNVDALVAKTLRGVVERPRFVQEAERAPKARLRVVASYLGPVALRAMKHIGFDGTEGHAPRLKAQIDRRIEQIATKIARTPAGLPRVRAIHQEMAGLFRSAFLRLVPYVASGMISYALLRRLARPYASPQDLAALATGLAGNVTTDMDQAVGDLADVAKAYPEVCARLKQHGVAALHGLEAVEGGRQFREALDAFLARYGMRGPSEIDIGRDRYRDRPDPIIQTVVGNLDQPIRSHRTHFEAITREAEAAGQRVLEAVRRGSLVRYLVVRRLLKTMRAFLAIREHPKYMLIRFLDITRKTLLEAGETLRLSGRLAQAEDVWHLELGEVIEALERQGVALHGRVAERQTALKRYQKHYPPRVLTNEGEAPVATHDTANVPAGALAGSAASAGVVEGIARVILDPHGQSLQKGEILVAPFTDPGWTTLFINAAGLVMEVGGLMTHGSVVAREYHIPAVVCVPGVTQRIRTGQRVRVNGNEGYVEILEEDA